MSQGTQRRLAAILAADVVGYSRLMEADEADTLATMKARRQELWEPKIQGFGGRVVGTAGDGMLVEFASAVAAVECAVAVQQGMEALNDGLAEDRQMLLRIGINIGEVIVDGEDIFGDGVNVAARLEALADPGGLAVSGNVHEQVHGKLDVTFEDAGEHDVKNIARSIRLWRWLRADQQPASSRLPKNAPLPLPDKPSIAVLPFDNMSDDPEQEYFADGMSEDIITDLSKIAGLFVIARNSSFAYKGQPIDISTVAGELGVRYVLEGSVRRGGSRVRVNAQLIDATTGGHMWAERYDRDMTDIFAVQDELTENIVKALAITLGDEEESRIGQKGTDNLAAYEYMMRGREHFLRTNFEDVKLAKHNLEKAIELDPNFGLPYAYLAQIHAIDYVNGWSDDPQDTIRQAHELAKRGVNLMPDDAHVHLAFGSILLWQRRHDEAIAEAERAVELDGNYAYGLFELGWYLQYAGRATESLEYFDRATRLDPHHADQFLHFMAQAHFQMANYEEAIDILQRRLVRNPQSDASRMLLAACYGHLGNLDAARVVWGEIMSINPDFSLEQRRKVLPYKNPESFEQIVDGLRKAGLPEA